MTIAAHCSGFHCRRRCRRRRRRQPARPCPPPSAFQALICRNLGTPLPPALDSVVARFLGSPDALYYWPAPVGQPQARVADAVRQAFRQPVRLIWVLQDCGQQGAKSR